MRCECGGRRFHIEAEERRSGTVTMEWDSDGQSETLDSDMDSDGYEYTGHATCADCDAYHPLRHFEQVARDRGYEDWEEEPEENDEPVGEPIPVPPRNDEENCAHEVSFDQNCPQCDESERIVAERLMAGKQE